MKTQNLFLSLIFILSFSYVKSQDSGIREVKPFYQLSVFGNLDVELVKGKKESVEIFPGNFEIEDVITENEGTELKVKLTSKILSKESTIKIKITYIKLREISTTGGADVWSQNVLSGDEIKIKAASGGTINFNINTNVTEVKVISGSTVSLQGKTNTLDITSNSGGVLSAFELESKNVYAKASVGGKIKVTATKKIEASATSAYIGYKGNPEKVFVKENIGANIIAVGDNEVEDESEDE